MGWFSVIERVEGGVLSLLEEQMFFHIFNAFLTLWNADRQKPACFLYDFFSHPGLVVEQHSGGKGAFVKYCPDSVSHL